MADLLGLNDNVLGLNDHSLITSLMCSHYVSMSQLLARHFAHYAAIRALDPLRKYEVIEEFAYSAWQLV